MADRKHIIAPSVLSADFADVTKGIQLVEKAGADWIHLDVMDGVFVPPITFGSQMAAAIRSRTELQLDAHLMTVNPGSQVAQFAEAGVDRLTFHLETEIHSHRLLNEIKAQGMKAGIAIVPSTPVSALTELLDVVDQILVMTVNPGYGGQSLIPSTLNKVRELAEMRAGGRGDFLIITDGGFSRKTAQSVWDSGVDVAVMGSAFFNAENPVSALKDCRR